MSPAGFAAASHQWEFLRLDLFDDFRVVQRVSVDVDGPPAAFIFFIDWDDAYAALAGQVRLEGRHGPWFADDGVGCLLLAAGFRFPADIDGTVSAVQATKDTRKALYEVAVHKR